MRECASPEKDTAIWGSLAASDLPGYVFQSVQMLGGCKTAPQGLLNSKLIHVSE